MIMPSGALSGLAGSGEPDTLWMSSCALRPSRDLFGGSRRRVE